MLIQKLTGSLSSVPGTAIETISLTLQFAKWPNGDYFYFAAEEAEAKRCEEIKV